MAWGLRRERLSAGTLHGVVVNTEFGVSQNRGTLFGGPYNKDYSILGSMLGSPCFGKLPSIIFLN